MPKTGKRGLKMSRSERLLLARGNIGKKTLSDNNNNKALISVTIDPSDEQNIPSTAFLTPHPSLISEETTAEE